MYLRLVNYGIKILVFDLIAVSNKIVESSAVDDLQKSTKLPDALKKEYQDLRRSHSNGMNFKQSVTGGGGREQA